LRISREYAGTPSAPTVIRSEVKWKAVIYGSLEHGVYVADYCNYVVIDGLEVAGARIDGIKISGDNGVVRNCWVHGSGSQGISIHGKKYWTIENCLVEFNGQNVQFHHGIYADGQDYIVRNNVVRHNSGYGMQLYPDARRGTVVNNLVYGHPRKGGIVLQLKSAGKNVIANNTIADNALGINIYAGRGDVLVNNIFVGPSPIQKDSKTVDLVMDYNLCSPACTQGEHGLEGDPAFVYAARGVYWLKAASPAIGAGAPEYAPAADFWGRVRKQDAPVDLGAFPFVPYLTTSEARGSWYSGYPYRYTPGKASEEMPDLWAGPDPAAAAPAPLQ
jgi:parallel beta-helix repeat protein